MKKINLMIVSMWLLIGAFIVYMVPAHSQVSFRQAQVVFGQLYNISGQHAKLYYSPSLVSNAWTDGFSVTITQGMLNDLRNNDELAMVMGHELGHKALEHNRPKEHPRQEMDADDVGYYYCHKLGYKRCIGALRTLQKKHGNGGGDKIHPTWTKRIKGLTRHK